MTVMYTLVDPREKLPTLTGRLAEDNMRLQKAIKQVQGGNFLLLIDEPDGKERLVGWLNELNSFREERAAQKKAETMDSLIRGYRLPREEATLVYDRMIAGHSVEYEEGI